MKSPAKKHKKSTVQDRDESAITPEKPVEKVESNVAEESAEIPAEIPEKEPEAAPPAKKEPRVISNSRLSRY